MATNYSKWINVAIATVVVLALSLFTFTDSASAAVVNSYSVVSNSRDVLTSITLPVPSSSTAVASSSLLKVGNALIDGVFYNDFTFDVSYQRRTNNYNGVLINFNFRPMYAKYDGDTSVFKISEFSGHTVSLYLPQYLGSGSGYSSTYEWVPLTIGGDYGTNYSNLFLTQYKPTDGLQAYNWTSSDYTYHHFTFDTSFARFTPSLSGPYSNYTGIQLLTYVAQTLTARFGTDRNIQARTSVAFNINYFPDVLSYAEKAQLEKLDSISGDLDELLNSGSGQFGDMKDQMQDASDKAEQGNQEIEDNAPKPDIDNTHDDTTDIIDSVLTENGENVSNILAAILGSNIINGMLLISISVGSIKYIFFGKG